MALKSIQQNIKQNTKDFSEYGLWVGGLDISAKNIDQFDPLRTGYARIFWVRLPRFMKKMDEDATKRFKHLVEMGFTRVDGKIFSVNASVYHEDIPGAEFLLLLRAEGNRDFGALEGERNGPAVNEGELVRPVEKPHVHASAVRSVMVNNLEMGVLKLRLGHEVLENKTVLDLGNTEDGVEGSVGFCHFRNDGDRMV